MLKNINVWKQNHWTTKVNESNDFERFSHVHKSVNYPSSLWLCARRYPHILSKIANFVKLLCIIPRNDMCNDCGMHYSDYVIHLFCHCSAYYVQRERFWNDIQIFPVNLEAELVNVSDSEFCKIMLGAPPSGLDRECHFDFMKVCVNAWSINAKC